MPLCQTADAAKVCPPYKVCLFAAVAQDAPVDESRIIILYILCLYRLANVQSVSFNLLGELKTSFHFIAKVKQAHL